MKKLLTTFACLLGLQAHAQINQDTNYEDFVRLMDSIAITIDELDTIFEIVGIQPVYINQICYTRTGQGKDKIWISLHFGWYEYPESYFVRYANQKRHEERTAN
jgi:hypothetical protein